MLNYDIEYFRARCKVDPQTNCWNWRLAGDGTGGGVIGTGRQTLKASRVAYNALVGPIPPGLLVLHSCDNRACCNPAHLRVGTQQENMQDMVARKRSAAGTKNGMYTGKLTTSIVLEIRSSPKRNIDLAAQYGVTPSMIGKIKHCTTWRHI